VKENHSRVDKPLDDDDYIFKKRAFRKWLQFKVSKGWFLTISPEQGAPPINGIKPLSFELLL
jgi:hypothetical protein